jgi:glycosyltransferase involved in cell wall biosynthesis
VRVLITLGNVYEPPWKEGVANLARRLAGYLEAQGDTVQVVGWAAMHRAGSAGAQFKATSWTARWHLLTRVIRQARQFAPDALFLFASCSSGLGFKSWLMRALTGRPLVVYVSGLGYPLWGYRVLLRADKVLVGSPFLQRYFPGAPIIYPFAPVHLKPDAPRPSVEQALLRSPRTFLFLGSWEPGRGVEDLLEAMALAREKVEVRLILALNGYGRNKPQELAARIEGLGLQQAVEMRGVVDINDVYRETDAVVIPRSRPYRMAFPVRIIEAMLMRRPLIVTEMCDMHKLIDGCGLAARPGDPTSLAQAIVTLATDPELYRRCVDQCAVLARRYDSERSLAKLYREMAGVANR